MEQGRFYSGFALSGFYDSMSFRRESGFVRLFGVVNMVFFWRNDEIFISDMAASEAVGR